MSAPYRGSGQRPGSQRFYWDLKAIEHISIIKIATVHTQNLMIKEDNFMSKPATKKLVVNLALTVPHKNGLITTVVYRLNDREFNN